MTLEIKPGAFYRTRDGRKVYIGWIAPPDSGNVYAVFGHIDFKPYSWTVRGEFHVGERCFTDLVEEWREPVTKTWWLNVYDNRAFAYNTEELANAVAGPDRRVCKKVEITY